MFYFSKIIIKHKISAETTGCCTAVS